jgi:putative DNA primase/helicase
MLGDKELVAILQEFMGYVVRGGEYVFHKALWLSGSGRNGKSTFIDLLKKLIGEENYATLSIKQIVTDKFASSMLDGKLANFSEETSPEELADSGPFKNLTGDGEVNAQKKFGDPYQFRNRAKLIMSYNEVPVLKDMSPGMLSRPIILPFKRDLSNDSAQDKGLKKKLFAELPGIFNFALAGWLRLEAQGKFTESAKSTIEMEEVREASCSVAQWARESIEFLSIDSVVRVKPRALYEAYKRDVGQYAYAEQKFYKRFAMISNAASRRRRGDHGHEYAALRLRSNTSILGEF